MKQSPTIDEIMRLKRDLEKRLIIDIDQFERDTGVNVVEIRLQHIVQVGVRLPKLIDVEAKVELGR